MNSFDMFREGVAALSGRAPTPRDRGNAQRERSPHQQHDDGIEMTVYRDLDTIESIDLLEALNTGPANEVSKLSLILLAVY